MHGPRLNLHFGIRFSQIRSRNPNEIIFGLNDGYYAADFDQKVRLIMWCFNIVRSVGILFSKRTSVDVAGSVRAEEKQFASGRPEFRQKLLQCFLPAEVRIKSCGVQQCTCFICINFFAYYKFALFKWILFVTSDSAEVLYLTYSVCV